jgi:hypothetical protein
MLKVATPILTASFGVCSGMPLRGMMLLICERWEGGMEC